MDTKLIFFDIDGTILDEHTHTVPLSAINAIKKAQQNGHQCFINTGRPRSTIDKISPIYLLMVLFVVVEPILSIITKNSFILNSVKNKDDLSFNHHLNVKLKQFLKARKVFTFLKTVNILSSKISSINMIKMVSQSIHIQKMI